MTKNVEFAVSDVKRSYMGFKDSHFSLMHFLEFKVEITIDGSENVLVVFREYKRIKQTDKPLEGAAR